MSLLTAAVLALGPLTGFIIGTFFMREVYSESDVLKAYFRHTGAGIADIAEFRRVLLEKAP